MNNSVKKVLHWCPRVVCVLFAIVMSYFVLTVINEGGTLYDTALNLMAHFIPVAVFVFILVFAWEWEWVAILYVIAAPVLLIWKWDMFPSNSFYINSGILFFAGILFLINWFTAKNLKKGN